MKTTVLVIGVIKKGDQVLLRKKPDGSPPYKETWYLFGGTLDSEHQNPEEAIISSVKKLTGIDIKVTQPLSWDTECKPDLEGTDAFYIYLDCLCEYVSGELTPGPGIEKLEWVHVSDLKTYDLVPPSVKLFQKLGYLEK